MVQTISRSLTLFCISFWLSAGSAQTQILDVCALENVALSSSLNLSATQVNTYIQKIKNECLLEKKAQALALELSSSYNLKLQNVTVYQALRFVQRSYYDKAKTDNIPLPVLYQIKNEDYLLPISKRSTQTWDNWTTGILQLEPLTRRLSLGERLTVADITEAHKGFYKFSDEIGPLGNPPHPGVLKPPESGTIKWWKLAPAYEIPRLIALVNSINNRYKEMTLLGSPSAEDPTDHLPLRVRKLLDGNYYLYGASAKANPQHLFNILRFTNAMLAQAYLGQHMVWQGKPFTPGEVAYIVQQFFVHVHPFYDGNGRTSRLLQEALLAVFGMPHGASGDLMAIDLMITQDDYYKLAMSKNHDLLNRVQYCIEQVYRQADPGEQIPYDCRIIK